MQNEEKYPLLLVFAEENGGGGGGYREPRRVFLERGSTIASGANAVFSKWPGHITSCWSTIVLFLATIGLLLAFSLILAAFGHLALSANHALLRQAFECRLNRTKRGMLGDNNYTVYLVHSRRNWTRNQLDLVDEIAHHFKNIDIQVLNFNKKVIRQKALKATSKATTKKTSVKATSVWATGEDSNEITSRISTNEVNPDVKKWETFLNINIGNRKLLKMLLVRKGRKVTTAAAGNTEKLIKSKIADMSAVDSRIEIHKSRIWNREGDETLPKRTLQEITKAHKNVHVVNTTLSKYFYQTSLEEVWPDLNENLLDLSIRVQQIWQYGGVSFKIPADTSDSEEAAGEWEDARTSWNKREEVQLLKTLIRKGEKCFQRLPEGLVTVDEDGLHLETKTSCHAFFGDILANIRTATSRSSEKKLLRKSIVSFCKRDAVDSEYCRKVFA